MKKLLLSLLILSSAGFAINDKLTSGIKQSLKGTLPKVNVDSINSTPVANLYQVVSGKKVFYVDSSGRYLLVGNLIDLATQTNLTQQQVEDLAAVNWDELPLNLAIRRVNGDGKRRIAIFTDPDCPFCKNLERETIPKLTNVTIYYFLFPLPTHQSASLHAKQLLCSEMSESAFIGWMNNGDKLQDNTSCDRAKNLDVILNLGKNLGVEQTPTIILPNGKVVVGLVPPDYLNQLITNAMPDVVNTPASESKLVASGVVQNKSK